MMNLGDGRSRLRALVICLLVLHLGNPISRAHEGVHNRKSSQETAKRKASTSGAEDFCEARVTREAGYTSDKVCVTTRTPQRFLVEVDNMAGITAPLSVSAIDVAMSPRGPAKWCTIEIIDSPFTSRFLTGAKREYKVMQVTPHIAGMREVRIAGDAGQGTQDLGFRATTDVRLDVASKRPNYKRENEK